MVPIERLVERVIEVTPGKRAVRAIEIGGNDQYLRRIMNIIRARTGHDLSHDKRATIMRRVSRRMHVSRPS